MEQNKPKFRLRLNLFDGVILVIALMIAALLAWLILRPTPTNKDNITEGIVQYTVRIRWPEGTSRLIQIGDELKDNIQNCEVGEVVDVQVEPSRLMVVNQAERRQLLAPIEGYEDVLLTIQAPCEISPSNISLDEATYIIRISGTAYLRGEGYMGSGTVETIKIIETFEDGQEVDK